MKRHGRVPRGARAGTPASAAFTLTELLLVIAIFIIMLGVAIPAFNAILYASRQTTADATLRAALRAARDTALRSGPGRDTAAVFFFERNGRASVVTCVSAGRLRDLDDTGQNPVVREVFVPAEGATPAQLPPGWVVSGLAVTDTIDRPGAPRSAVQHGWYRDENYPAGQRNWVFPETGFFDIDRHDQGALRQTFMIRFEGGSGLVDAAGGDPVLVFAPSPSLAYRNRTDPPFKDFRSDQVTKAERYAQSVLLSERVGTRQLTPAHKRGLLGDVSSDTVLARPVPEVALYSLAKMASAIGARRMNPDTGCLYAMPGGSSIFPTLDAGLFSGGITPSGISARVNEWIEATDPMVRERQSPDARIFTVTRRGEVLVMLQEVSP